MNPLKKYEIIVTLFWIGLSLFAMIFSYRLRLGEFHSPGPGLMPFILGILLLLISLYVLIKSLLKKGREKDVDETPGREQSKTNYGKIGLVLAALFAYAFLLERLGFLITTWIFLFLLFRSAGNRWITALVGSTSTVLVTFFVFTWLGCRFPVGFFG